MAALLLVSLQLSSQLVADHFASIVDIEVLLGTHLRLHIIVIFLILFIFMFLFQICILSMLFPVFLVIQYLDRLRPRLALVIRWATSRLLMILADVVRRHLPCGKGIIIVILLPRLLDIGRDLSFIDAIIIKMIGSIEIANQILLRLILIRQIRLCWYVLILGQFFMARVLLAPECFLLVA